MAHGETHLGELRLLLDELCCDLCRFEHVTKYQLALAFFVIVTACSHTCRTRRTRRIWLSKRFHGEVCIIGG